MGHLCRPFCGTFSPQACSYMDRWLDWQACFFQTSQKADGPAAKSVSCHCVCDAVTRTPRPLLMLCHCCPKRNGKRWSTNGATSEYGSGTVGEQCIAECLVPHVCFCHLDYCHAYLEEIWRSGRATGTTYLRKGKIREVRQVRLLWRPLRGLKVDIMLTYRRDDNLQVAAKRFTSVHFHLISLPQSAAEKHHMTPSNHFLHFWTFFFLIYPLGIGPLAARMTPS